MSCCWEKRWRRSSAVAYSNCYKQTQSSQPSADAEQVLPQRFLDIWERLRDIKGELKLLPQRILEIGFRKIISNENGTSIWDTGKKYTEKQTSLILMFMREFSNCSVIKIQLWSISILVSRAFSFILLLKSVGPQVIRCLKPRLRRCLSFMDNA